MAGPLTQSRASENLRSTDLLWGEAPQTWIVLQSLKRSAVGRPRGAGSARTRASRGHAVAIVAPRLHSGCVGGKRRDAIGGLLMAGRLHDNFCRAPFLYGRVRCLDGLSQSGRPAQSEPKGDHGKYRRGMQGSGPGAGGHGCDPLPTAPGAITLFEL
jgi:hypothetical protein